MPRGFGGYGYGRRAGYGRKGFGLGRLIMAKLMEKGSVSLEEIQRELPQITSNTPWTPGWRCWMLYQQFQQTQQNETLEDLIKQKEELERELEELKRKIDELKKKSH